LPTRVQAARSLAVALARLAADTRCQDVVVLDVRNLSPVTDFYVIATGTSARQMRTAVEDVEELAASRGYPALSRSGYEGETWMLLDLVDVVVHVFSDAARQFYDLDNLWGDARKVPWREGARKDEG